MTDTPGWASPGSAPSDRPGSPDGPPEEAPTERHEPTGAPEPSGSPSPTDVPENPHGTTDPHGPQGASPEEGPGRREPEGRNAPGSGATAAGGTPGPDAHGSTGDTAPPQRARASTGGAVQWSKKQPPPSSWITPGAPGPGGPPPGAAGGGWGGWQGGPPAVKPGVIPLRPLGVGEILDGAVATMRAYWRTVLGISLSVAVLIEIVLVLLQGLVLDDTTDTDALDDPNATLAELGHALRDVAINNGVVLFVTLLGLIVATALLTTVTSRAVLGRPVTTAEAWQDARPQLPRLFALTLLLPLLVLAVVAVGVLPGVLVAAVGSGDAGAELALLGGLAGAVVALWLAIRFALASPALMLERQTVARSLSRSAKLVKGSWWRVLGVQLLATIIANIVASIILVPFTLLAGAVSGEGTSSLLADTGGHGWTFLVLSGVGSVIGSTITFPVTAGVVVLLYIDQRIRREALDLELARAAGIQGYGSEPPGTVPGS